MTIEQKEEILIKDSDLMSCYQELEWNLVERARENGNYRFVTITDEIFNELFDKAYSRTYGVKYEK